MIRYPFLELSKVNSTSIDDVREAVTRVVESGYYIGGPEVKNFENLLAHNIGTTHAIGVSNGLDALRLIFRAYIESGRLAPGDDVIVPANTYIASILAITDNNLNPILVEPNELTMNLDTRRIESAITPRTRAILTVHLYGRICYDSTMREVADRHDLLIIEDNAQAIGAYTTDGQASGSLGDAAAFSFYPTKNLGAMGDAGAVTTDSDELASTIRALANYGSDRRYHNLYKGLNCRMDPLQAAILAAKYPYLKHENAHRTKIATIYEKEITNPCIIKPLYGTTAEMVWHQYVVRVNDRDHFRDYMTQNGVGTDVHYATPPHRQPCYSQWSNIQLPITQSLADTVVSLPISSGTSIEDAHSIANIINYYTPLHIND